MSHSGPGFVCQRKSLWLAYLCALPPLGLLGVHRWYLNHRASAVLFPWTLGGVGVWYVADLLRLPEMVARWNRISQLACERLTAKQAPLLPSDSPDPQIPACTPQDPLPEATIPPSDATPAALLEAGPLESRVDGALKIPASGRTTVRTFKAHWRLATGLEVQVFRGHSYRHRADEASTLASLRTSGFRGAPTHVVIRMDLPVSEAERTVAQTLGFNIQILSPNGLNALDDSLLKDVPRH